MSTEEPTTPVHWGRTVGAPRPGDPRELHQFFGRLPDAFDLEPWDNDSDGVDAHYVRDTQSLPVEEDGRTVWRYLYHPR